MLVVHSSSLPTLFFKMNSEGPVHNFIICPPRRSKLGVCPSLRSQPELPGPQALSSFICKEIPAD